MVRCPVFSDHSMRADTAQTAEGGRGGIGSPAPSTVDTRATQPQCEAVSALTRSSLTLSWIVFLISPFTSSSPLLALYHPSRQCQPFSSHNSSGTRQARLMRAAAMR